VEVLNFDVGDWKVEPLVRLDLDVLLIAFSSVEYLLSELRVAAKRINMGPFACVAKLFLLMKETVLKFEKLVRPLRLIVCHLTIHNRDFCGIDDTIVEGDHLSIKVRSPLEKII
jgi:hypothetical protein